MIAVCQQPNYFPWLGYLEQCARADVLVVLDSVQWIRKGRQHRTRVLPHTSSRSPYQWLTLPVHGHGHRGKALAELELDRTTAWPRHHWHSLQAIYGSRPHFKTQLEPLIRPWFEKATSFTLMADAALSSLKLCLKALGLAPAIEMASQLEIRGRKSDLLIGLCQAVGADTYYSGLGAPRYLDLAAFRSAGVRFVQQKWKHTEYDQGRAGRFQSHLSVLDALANAPLEEIKAWLAPKPWMDSVEL